MNKPTRWTPEEDKVLVQLIEKYPQNLSKAFREASCRLPRTVSACQFHWYQTLSNPNSPTYVGATFVAASKRRLSVNRKNYIDGKSKQTPKKNKVSVWKRMLVLLNITK